MFKPEGLIFNVHIVPKLGRQPLGRHGSQGHWITVRLRRAWLTIHTLVRVSAGEATQRLQKALFFRSAKHVGLTKTVLFECMQTTRSNRNCKSIFFLLALEKPPAVKLLAHAYVNLTRIVGAQGTLQIFQSSYRALINKQDKGRQQYSYQKSSFCCVGCPHVVAI